MGAAERLIACVSHFVYFKLFVVFLLLLFFSLCVLLPSTTFVVHDKPSCVAYRTKLENHILLSLIRMNIPSKNWFCLYSQQKPQKDLGYYFLGSATCYWIFCVWNWRFIFQTFSSFGLFFSAEKTFFSVSKIYRNIFFLLSLNWLYLYTQIYYTIRKKNDFLFCLK